MIYRVTMPKQWKGPAKMEFKGALFDKRDDELRVREMRLTAGEVADLRASGFLVTKMGEPKVDAQPKTEGGKRKAAAKAKAKAKAEAQENKE